MNMEIKRCPHPESTADIPVLLDREGVEWLSMNAHNWADRFPYKPMVRFRMAHCGDAVLLHFQVAERSIRAFGIFSQTVCMLSSASAIILLSGGLLSCSMMRTCASIA